MLGFFSTVAWIQIKTIDSVIFDVWHYVVSLKVEGCGISISIFYRIIQEVSKEIKEIQ